MLPREADKRNITVSVYKTEATGISGAVRLAEQLKRIRVLVDIDELEAWFEKYNVESWNAFAEFVAERNGYKGENLFCRTESFGKWYTNQEVADRKLKVFAFAA